MYHILLNRTLNAISTYELIFKMVCFEIVRMGLKSFIEGFSRNFLMQFWPL